MFADNRDLVLNIELKNYNRYKKNYSDFILQT